MKTILMIDDEEDFTTIFSERFKKIGFNVIVANSGLDGIEKAKSQKPDLILLDIKMPDQDGLHVFKIIKSDEKCKNIPIIIISGLANQEELQTLTFVMGIDPDDIIEKPFDSKFLIDKINKVLKI